MRFDPTPQSDPGDVLWIAQVLARHGRLTFRLHPSGRMVATWHRKSGSGRTRADAVLDLAARVGVAELAGSGCE
jgi:hypothetical protein